MSKDFRHFLNWQVMIESFQIFSDNNCPFNLRNGENVFVSSKQLEPKAHNRLLELGWLFYDYDSGYAWPIHEYWWNKIMLDASDQQRIIDYQMAKRLNDLP